MSVNVRAGPWSSPKLGWAVHALGLFAILLFCAPLAATAALDRWEPYPPGVGGPWGGSVRRFVSPDPAGPVLWAATGGGVYLSQDGGDTWAARNTGLESLDVTDLDLCRSVPTRLIAATADKGIHLSADGGATWQRVDRFATLSNFRPQDHIWRVVADPVDPQHVYAATFTDSYDIFEFTGSGNPLADPWVNLGTYNVSERAVAENGTVFFADRSGGVWRIDGAGAVPQKLWQSPSSAPIVGMALPGGDGAALAVAQGGAGLWVSADGGAVWEEVTGLASSNPWFSEVDAVAADSLDGSRLVYHLSEPLGTDTLYESSDLGTSRTPLVVSESRLEVLALLATSAAEFLGENRAGVFRRLGRAGEFHHASLGLAAYTAVALDYDPAGDGGLAVAGGDRGGGSGGVNLWDPAAGAWLRRRGELPATASHLVRYQAGELWVGMDGSGLYRSPDQGLSWQASSSGISVAHDNLISGLVFAGADPNLAAAATLGKIHYTTTAGASWAPAESSVFSPGWRLDRDSREPLGLFAAGPVGADGGFLVSADGGSVWYDPLPGAFTGLPVEALVAVPGAPGRALVGTRDAGVYQSFSGGESWEPLAGVGLPAGGMVAALAVAERTGNLWIASHYPDHGVFFTLDGGATWHQEEPGLLLADGTRRTVYALAFEPGSTRLVAAVHGGGLHYLEVAAPPQGSVSIQGGASYTNQTDVTLTLAASSHRGSVEAVRFSADLTVWGDWLPLTPTAAWTLAGGDGVNTVYAQFRDSVGLLSEPAADTIVLDTVAPVVTIGAPPPGPGNDPTPQLSYVASDGAVTVALNGVDVVAASGESLGPLQDGDHRVRVEAVDAAGNVGSAEVAFTVDTVPPAVLIQAPLAGSVTHGSPALLYSAEAGSVVEVWVDGVAVNVASGGLLGPFDGGAHAVRVQAVDAVGNLGSDEVTFTVDATIPVVTIAEPLAGWTNHASPTLRYSADEGAVTVLLDGLEIGQRTGDSLGPLAEGEHTLRVEVESAAGNVGSAEVVFAVDSLAPAVEITGPADLLLTNNPEPALTFTAGDGAATVWLNDVQVAVASGATLGPLDDGAYTVRVESVDAAGNVGWHEVTFTVDTVAPPVEITGPADLLLTNNSEPVLTFTAGDGTATVWLNDVQVAVASGATLGPLDDGVYTVRVESVDAAGNRSWADVTFTVDATPPTVTITAPQAGTTNQASPTLAYATAGTVVAVWVDGAEQGVLPSGAALGPLADGSHAVRVEAVDAAGNRGSAEVIFTVDTNAPGVTVLSPQSGEVTNQPRPTLHYTADAGSVAVWVGEQALGAVPSGSTLGPLADGDHTVRVEVADPVGNLGWAEVTFTVDTLAPSVAITGPVAGPTNNPEPELTFTAGDGTVNVLLDGVAVSQRSGDTLGPLADGAYTVRVESVDAAGNLGSAEVSFTVDTTAPTVAITAPAAGLTNNPQPVLTFTAGDGVATVFLNGVPVAVTSGASLGPLSDASYTVRVEALDAAGNLGEAEVAFTVDTVAPSVTIAAPEAGPTNNPAPALTFAASDGEVSVWLDGVAIPQRSGDTLGPLADGDHRVRVEAVDAAGNVGSAEVVFVVVSPIAESSGGGGGGGCFVQLLGY